MTESYGDALLTPRSGSSSPPTLASVTAVNKRGEEEMKGKGKKGMDQKKEGRNK
jgi:hypothetical protein